MSFDEFAAQVASQGYVEAKLAALETAQANALIASCIAFAILIAAIAVIVAFAIAHHRDAVDDDVLAVVIIVAGIFAFICLILAISNFNVFLVKQIDIAQWQLDPVTEVVKELANAL